VTVELLPEATIEAAWAALVARYPVLESGRSSVRFARNGEYAAAETTLADGDEVAVIPPVSGGANDQPIERILEIRAAPFDAAILAELAERLATPEDGAVVGFLGRTRRTAGTPAPGQEAEAARFEGSDVLALEYEALEPMAIAELGRIADEIAERFGVDRLAIVHRIGRVALGEVSIAVVAVAGHRGAAFDAARYAMDETKVRVPIWKAEEFADGRVWVGQPARSGPEDS
jgi:molybdopterin synthase catalytic subunit